MLDILIKRRSIRKYRKQEVEEEKVQELIKAALLSPTSKNKFSWEFVVVRDKETLEDLSRARDTGAQFIKDAPLAFIILGGEEITDVWVEDASIAAAYIQLAAVSMGLGSCWVQIRERRHDSEKTAEKYVQGLLNIPQNKRVECIIAIGYPDEVKGPHNSEDLKYDRVHFDKY